MWRRCPVSHTFCGFRLITRLIALGLLCGLLSVASTVAAAEAGAERHSHGEPAAAGGQGEESQSTAPALSLEQLEAMALEGNPTLAQAAAQVQAAAGRTLQASLYPNPTVGYSGEEISAHASGGEHGGFVEQTIVTAGKLGLSRAVFQQEQVQAEELAKAQRLRVLNAVRLL